ncbi:hypothetical protein [Photobacterium sp. J15]|uniref:hypothetical protein n=1 Tax=Photobacterium sp. J15 TaxID=265901 RepID=UPI0007E41702|nr:hypothetical protein [Photobacterium sp. J15]
MYNIKPIITALIDTASLLEKHLCIYNPVMNRDKNGVPEANLTLQFAHQCLKNGWLVYPETSNIKQNTNTHNPIRVDLHVICPGQFMLTVESKKFYSSEKGKEIISDYTRAQSIEYCHKHDSLPHFVLMLAITENSDYEDWWRKSENWNNESETWKELAGILQSDRMVKSSLPMHEDKKTHHLLYAISKVR